MAQKVMDSMLVLWNTLKASVSDVAMFSATDQTAFAHSFSMLLRRTCVGFLSRSQRRIRVCRESRVRFLHFDSAFDDYQIA